MASYKKGKVNEDLQSERNTTTFDVEELINLVDGDAEATAYRRRIEQLFTEDPRFDNEVAPHSVPYEKIYEKGMQHTNFYIKRLQECKDELQMEPNSYESLWLLRKTLYFPYGSPLFLHIMAFSYTIFSQSDENQFAKWGPLMLDFKILGAYCQTELGHGSNLRELETTATYDPSTEEFILHSPTPTSIKFWPGGLAKTGNYAVVLAQLYTKGECKGVHTFLVQLRSLEDHMPMPGITIGDIGPKWDMHTADNGFLKMDHVRIPRDQMLMKNSQVLPDGTYIKPENRFGTYGTMLMIRLNMVFEAHKLLGKASTIAVRYGAVRRQGRILPKEPEVKLLDYKTHQYRLVHNIATSYAFLFTFKHMTQSFLEHTLQPKAETLAELHALSSGMKAFAAQISTTGIEQCRGACGGVGYLLASNLPSLYTHQNAACTYEGENYVLFQQTGRFLMKSAKMAKEGQKLEGSVEFLNDFNVTRVINDPLEEMLQLYRRTAKSMIFKTNEKIQNDISSGKLPEIAWNENVIELLNCVKVFMQLYILSSISTKMRTTTMSGAVHDVLMTMFEYLGSYWIYENTGDFSLYGQIPPQLLRSVTNRIHILLAKLRPNLVGLTDAFDFHDKELNSILGRYDGNVYEHIIDYVEKIPDNKEKVHPSYEKYIRPLLKSQL